MKRFLFAAIILGIFAIGAGVLYFRSVPGSSTNDSKVAIAEKGAANAGTSTATGVNQAALPKDSKPSDPKPNLHENENPETKELLEKNPPPQNYGRGQGVPANSNAQTASVMAALKSGSHPERLTALMPSKKKFDREEFLKNPQSFLDVVEPGRVFQTMEPAEDVPALKIVTAPFVQLKQGDTTRLVVKGAPNGLVAFSSFDMGTFLENKLNSISVQADKDGIASATFVASPGALNDVNILAGSPMASGQVKFLVTIEQTGPVKK